MLALTSPTSGGRSVGIVRSRTKTTELVGSLVGSLVGWLSSIYRLRNMKSSFHKQQPFISVGLCLGPEEDTNRLDLGVQL
jgi:hypothetical protein